MPRHWHPPRRVVDPYDLKEVTRVLKEELAAEEPSVIISRRPCALLKYVKHNPPLSVDQDKCIGCKACLGIGCPAISYRDGKASSTAPSAWAAAYAKACAPNRQSAKKRRRRVKFFTGAVCQWQTSCAD